MNQKQRAITLDSACKCVVCEVETSDRTRGLCVTDYARFRAAIRQIEPGKRIAFEAMLIKQGQLLESRQGQKTGTEDDVFAKAVNKFLEASPPTESSQDTVNKAKILVDSQPENANRQVKRPKERRTK